MRPPLPVLMLLLPLLAGCGTPPEGPTDQAMEAATTAPDRDYDLTVRVSQERADGPAMASVEVQAFVLDAAGRPGPAIPRSTSQDGFAHFSFEDPVRVAVRATTAGWTREGVVLEVAEAVTAVDGPAILSERDLFLPLFHTELRLAAATALFTTVVQPAPAGSGEPSFATADLVLPEGLEAEYLSRLSAADVRVRWEDTASSRAHLSAALAWGGELWVRGEPSALGLVPGPREASFVGALPAEGRPATLDGAVLQAAAVLESAAVGDVPLAFEVRLAVSGVEPPGLPVACHSMAACLVPDLPL